MMRPHGKHIISDLSPPKNITVLSRYIGGGCL